MESFLLESGENEEVEAIPRPVAGLHDGQGRMHGLDERPVLLVLRSLVDPFAQPGHLGRSKRIALRRHPFGAIMRSNSPNQLAFVTLSRHESGPTGLCGHQGLVAFLEIEPSLLQIGPMALETAARQGWGGCRDCNGGEGVRSDPPREDRA